MLTKLFFTKFTANTSKITLRFFSLAIVSVFLSGCLHQPVQEDLNLASEELSQLEDTSDSNTEIDTWQRIRNGFDLPDIKHKRVQQELNWYKRHPEYMKRVVERARPYLH